jgi:hypothetical protein
VGCVALEAAFARIADRPIGRAPVAGREAANGRLCREAVGALVAEGVPSPGARQGAHRIVRVRLQERSTSCARSRKVRATRRPPPPGGFRLAILDDGLPINRHELDRKESCNAI